MKDEAARSGRSENHEEKAPYRGSGRDEYRHVGAAMRQAIEAAIASRLTARQNRVFMAVLALVPSWSRLADRYSVAAVAKLACVDYQYARKTLRILSAMGIVVYEGGVGRGKLSLIGLPPADEKGSEATPVLGFPCLEKGGELVPPSSYKKGGDLAAKEGRSSPPTRGGPREGEELREELIRGWSPDLEQPLDETEVLVGEVVDEEMDDAALQALCEATQTSLVSSRPEALRRLGEIREMHRQEGGDPNDLAQEIFRRASALKNTMTYPVTPKSLAVHWIRAGTMVAETRDVLKTLGGVDGWR